MSWKKVKIKNTKNIEKNIIKKKTSNFSQKKMRKIKRKCIPWMMFGFDSNNSHFLFFLGFQKRK